VESGTLTVADVKRLQQEDFGLLETAQQQMVLLTSPSRGGTDHDREVKLLQTQEIHGSSSAERFITKSKVLRVIECAGPVRGVAQIGTELYVCTERSERVAVYDLNTYSETHHITVPGLKDPRGLAACMRNNCLYISDYQIKCIHRVDLLNKATAFGKWSLKAGPSGVSLTRAFNLLVTLPESIEEYKTSGSLIRSIQLHASIDNPLHAVELSSGQFVVCHAGNTQHRVCVVDAAGRIVHSYGSQPGSSTGLLTSPRSLAVHTNGHVFVADYNNDRVQVLSPTLTRLGDMTTPGHQLSQPCVLHFDEVNGRMYVGEWLTSSVLVVESA
jgi:DNA-binding beta-propeller fold protein YncE